jgi:vacuolar-type H+-ATPase subunit I/STV1
LPEEKGFEDMSAIELAVALSLAAFTLTFCFMVGFRGYQEWRGMGVRINMKKSLTLWGALLQQILALAWFQIISNDPSIVFSKSASEWFVIFMTSVPIVALGLVVAWRAYISNPNDDGPTNPPTP